MIQLKSAGHWYHRDGQSAHDSDLRDARKLSLLRSVTSIDKDMFKNEALERYKMTCLAEAAFENPRQPHESQEDYTKRIYEISQEHATKASEFGTKIHDSLDHYPATVPPEEIFRFIRPTIAWMEANIIEVISSEKVVVDLDIGVAGRMDRRVIHRDHGPLVLDFKTQGIKKDKKGVKKAGFYDSFVRQLSFYDAGEAKNEGRFPQIDRCMSVVIDSNEPDEPFVRLWEKQEVASAYEDFVIAAWSYYKKKDFWPIGKWDLCEKLKILPV